MSPLPPDMGSHQNFINLRRLREHTWHCGAIYDTNWPTFEADGWRWVDNMALGDVATGIQVIKDWQHKFDKAHVTIGQPFNVQEGRPFAYDSELFGLYVKDVTELVQTLYHDMLKWPDFDPKAWEK